MANALQNLRALIQAPLLAGQVIAITSGVARIQTPDGAQHSARGAATVGDHVYFRPGGAIEGEAPAVAFIDVDV